MDERLDKLTAAHDQVTKLIAAKNGWAIESGYETQWFAGEFPLPPLWRESCPARIALEQNTTIRKATKGRK